MTGTKRVLTAKYGGKYCCCVAMTATAAGMKKLGKQYLGKRYERTLACQRNDPASSPAG
ncbi:hypothetical protein ABH944_002777 [Caballeronia udeis]|uniref:Uncharacterized protein n=1 Tax=Caballeronia udeis TaxID=1232866 RepID=A0ABW8MGN6_9BURK